MNTKQKRTLARVIISFVILAALVVCERFSGVFDNGVFAVAAFLVPYIIIGYDVIYKAARNIVRGRIFDENFLMLTATIAAFAVGEYTEAAAVMLFYQVGELFQSCAVGKSRRSISAMMDICPEYACVEEDGVLKKIDPDDVDLGDIIVIKAGEKVPVDGIVTEGESYIDTAALTGESIPRRVCTGDSVISGCINKNGTLRVKTTKKYEDSTVSKILELVENAGSRKAKTENFITRFAKYYTPAVTVSASALAVLPPLILGGAGEIWLEWIKRACTFLVISCPCALVISVPMGFFGGIGAASKEGVLVKGGNFLELLSEMKTVVFDKTGTLTKGEFAVTKIIPNGCEEEELLETAALCEGYSNHPIAVSVREAYGKDLELDRVETAEESAGKGVNAVIDGQRVLVGNDRLMRENKIEFTAYDGGGTILYAAKNGAYMGVIVISDEIKDGTKEALAELKKAGVKQLVMLTGDREETAVRVAGELGIDTVYPELLPADKVLKVEELLGNSGKLAFAGDGINDAPVIMRADIGIAMGSMGSDAAIEAADIVIMDDDLQKIPKAVKISKKTLSVVRENIVFALGVKAAVLILGALGFANMWAAVFADVGVSVIAILNSMRTLKG